MNRGIFFSRKIFRSESIKLTRHWWFRFIENTAMIIEDSRQESSPLDNFHENSHPESRFLSSMTTTMRRDLALIVRYRALSSSTLTI